MVVIYEPLYSPGQELAEPAFRPLRRERNTHANWREFRILIDMYKDGLHREQRFTGLFSPKFGLKTGIGGNRLMQFVRANSDADVCFINPFAQLPYISFNVWMQGEVSHPGLILHAQELLDASGVKLRIKDVPRHGHAVVCYCNFWVGTERFWDKYVGGILTPIAEFLEANPDHPASRSALDETHHTVPAPFLPFIIERLFSSFLSLPSAQIVSRAYPMDPLQSCLNEFEKILLAYRRDDIDEADRLGIFPDQLKRDMAFMCDMWQAHNLAFYYNHPHPHTGHSTAHNRQIARPSVD